MSDVDASTVLASVDGVDITLGHVIAAVSLLPAQYQGLPDDTLFNGILDQMIQQQVLAASAEGDIDRQSELVLENERRAGLAGTGTLRAIDSIATAGLRWKPIQDPVLCKGEWDEAFIAPCRELGQLMAAGMDAGVF